jgi:hypothetical protein
MIGLIQGYTSFPQNVEATIKFRAPEDRHKEFPYKGATNIRHHLTELVAKAIRYQVLCTPALLDISKCGLTSNCTYRPAARVDGIRNHWRQRKLDARKNVCAYIKLCVIDLRRRI